MKERVISAHLTLKDKNFSTGLKKAGKHTTDFDRRMQQAKNKVEDFKESAVSGFASISKGAFGLVTAGAGLTGLGAIATDSFMEMDSAFDKFSAKTEISGDYLKDFKNSAVDVFESGFGDSIDQVADDMAKLNSMFNDTLGSGEAEDLAKGAYVISDLWGAEATEVGKVVKTMVDNFSDLSTIDAMDLITTAFQRTGDYSDDLLDTFNEYSMHFSKMGLSAEEFTGILIRGAENGAFNMDKVGDAVKELGIRVIDGSDTTKEGFEAMGLDAEDMANKFSEGGESANNAFQATIAGLASMEDPVERNAAGVALFGTQWEDLRDDVILSMADSASAVEGFEGATERAGETMHDNLASKMTEIGRKIKTGFTEAFSSAGGEELIGGLLTKVEEFIPVIETGIGKAVGFGQAIQEHWGPISETLIGIGVAAGTFLVVMGGFQAITGIIALVNGFKKALTLASAGQWALNGAMLASPLTWVAVGIALVVAGAVMLYRHWDLVKSKTIELWNAFWDSPLSWFVLGPFGALVKTVKLLADHWDWVCEKFNSFVSAIKSFELPGWVNTIGDKIGGAVSSFGNFINGSHATGLNRVPFDGYIAELHKDEMVVPAVQAEQLRSSGMDVKNTGINPDSPSDGWSVYQPTLPSVGNSTTNNDNTTNQSSVIDNSHVSNNNPTTTNNNTTNNNEKKMTNHFHITGSTPEEIARQILKALNNM